MDNLRNTGGSDTKWGVRVVISTDVAFNCGCGGIAYINSFNWNTDTPVFVFNTSEIGVAEAASHEVGHSLGLSHDGTSTTSYYQGNGLGTDREYWSTIMGVGYYVNVSQWDKGEYFGSNNGGANANYNKGPDDLNIITTYNGFGYKADDYGDALATASPLTLVGSTISGSGLISKRTDVDYFQFTTGAGAVTLNVNPAAIGANLDIEASLYDSNGVLLTSSNPLQALNASISTNLAAGQYYLKIDGVGAGNPTTKPPTGYTDYDSLGQYLISGSVVALSGDSISIAAGQISMNESNTGSSNSFAFTVSRSGNTSGTSTVNYAVTGSGASPANAEDFEGGVFPSGSLTFDLGVISQVITVKVQGDTTVESNEGFTVSLSNPSPPTIIGVGSASSTILNDDSAPVPPSFAISATDASKAEGTGSASTPFVFTITRSGDPSSASSVRYTVSATGSNRANSNDFTGGFANDALVNFASGMTTVDVTILVNADSSVERNEKFKVTLANAVGATIAIATANGSIVNDDGTGAAKGEQELIAVADPLWMFVPSEFLSQEQLSVPVVTWINGKSFLGDFAHDHDDEESLMGYDDESEQSLAAPWNFIADSERLVALLSSSRTNTRKSTVVWMDDTLADGILSVQLETSELEFMPQYTEANASKGSRALSKQRSRIIGQSVQAVDEVFADSNFTETIGRDASNEST